MKTKKPKPIEKYGTIIKEKCEYCNKKTNHILVCNDCLNHTIKRTEWYWKKEGFSEALQEVAKAVDNCELLDAKCQNIVVAVLIEDIKKKEAGK